MDANKFERFCKSIVTEYYNTKGEAISDDEIFVVWSCKTLQNNKALVSTTVKGSPYFEITHDGTLERAYVDVYNKKKNYIVYTGE